MVANTQSKRKPRNQQNASITGGVLYPPDYLETRRKVSPQNVESCQHCGASHEHLRRICCWEWYVPQKKYWEGGYLSGCLSCLKQSRNEWTSSTPHRSLLVDGG
jgi:hypothetical protein